uniref:Uncharacterized protein n=1 Tax=Chromera velia CCMP2878 TaxID=1169474 RepID=A0A0G4GGZ1_9ALVE|eukprot:Cvel_21867.t1-p1 / transcript=Cvel_21867.t1 / gene=Cvel_21867 / organism=Chromera_velia_CCMP2878 / gene_product=hypothetical protein / transcript_product=hypothetical protein / location=Cvel_scaffold2090:15550-17128(+) / protein_length=236 / sequence_SO=supercontig / SO=protein_coding / is_pseudo=false
MSDPYDKLKSTGGKLRLKGDDPGEKKKKKKKDKERERELEQGGGPTSSSSSSKRNREREESPVRKKEVPMVEGTGRIVITNDTIHGFETKFKGEVEIGDEVHVFHPKTLVVEKRIVTAVLSDRSLTVNEAFSSDIASTTNFHIKKESEALKERALKKVKKEIKMEEGMEPGLHDPSLKDEVSKRLEKQLQKSRNVLTYREKQGMGYKVVTEKLKGDVSREQLLDLRAKKNRDKYCW